MRFLAAAAIAVSLVMPALAHAAPPPSDAQLELARRFFKVTRFAENAEKMIQSMAPVAVDNEMRRNLSLGEEHRQALIEAMIESAAPAADRVLEHFAPIYAETFTAEELSGIISFYESPVGQSFIAKSDRLSDVSGQILQALLPAAQADMIDRFCSKVDCSKVAPEWDKPAPRPS